MLVIMCYYTQQQNQTIHVLYTYIHTSNMSHVMRNESTNIHTFTNTCVQYVFTHITIPFKVGELIPAVNVQEGEGG